MGMGRVLVGEGLPGCTSFSGAVMEAVTGKIWPPLLIVFALSVSCGHGDTETPSHAPPPPSSHPGPCTDADPTSYRLYPEDADADGYYDPDSAGICALSQPPGALPRYSGKPDCDDGDPHLAVGYFFDADGDGFAGSTERTVCGPPSGPPGGATDRVSLDCDDADPTLAVLYYPDTDGDGYADSHPQSVCGPPDEAPAGAVARPRGVDCDPGDPTRVRWQYPDVDGDGYGTEAEECLGAELVDGHADVSGDCDDADPEVNPFAVELWDDAVDSDCDGHDTPPVECWDDSLRYFACDELLPTDSACGSSDLAIVAADGSNDCVWGGYSWTVVVANFGQATASGFELAFMDSGRSERHVDISDTLLPGTQRAYYVRGIDSNPTAVQVTSSVPDCSSGNDVLSGTASEHLCPK